MELVCTSLPVHMCIQSAISPNPVLWVFCEGFIIGSWWIISSSLQSLSTPWRMEDGGWSGKFQDFNYGLVFWEINPHPGDIQEPLKSCLIRTKDTLITQEILRDLGVLWTGVKGQNFRTDALSVLTTWEFLSVLESPCQNPGTMTNIYIFYYFAPAYSTFPFECLMDISNWACPNTTPGIPPKPTLPTVFLPP